MANWVTISSLATGVGTLVLALATFSSVRTANRSAKASERSILGGILPLLVSSHTYDPEEKIRFKDNRWVRVRGGHAYAAAEDGIIYFVISLRNAGRGMAILDRWHFSKSEEGASEEPHDTSSYRRLTRDLYIAAGDTGLWQGAIRETSDPQFKEASEVITSRGPILIDIQYDDQEGGQRTVSRFALTHRDGDDWLVSTVRHWRLDGTNPR